MASTVKSSLAPTRKWLATQITAITGWVIAFINAGHWTTTLKIALVTIVGQALIGWLVPNDPAPGGVPRLKGQRGYALIETLVVVVIALVCLVVIVKLLQML